ncbi:tail Collar domain-containing protein [Aliidongia dinghuensis]|uniref:Tail Collar domain-containing protein n=1 Tax=Aliidongia dinghuensis TaxID=1867774 RepID=A0A8J3E4F1_9PROT|nr:tail fiber protein [Aliidongia dinghuensis]GGF26775.1 tail Collar domain-containing protein [Aliidongia dinghuensis]
MAEPFLGEMIMFAGNFAPRGYALCNGQILSINQNTALFSLLGTTYGGNGVTTFALPNMQSRITVGAGQGPGLSPYNLGGIAGEEAHTLQLTEMPTHTHNVMAVANGTANGTNVPSTGVLLGTGTAVETNSPAEPVYSTNAPSVAMGPLGTGGGGQPHENRMPFLAVTWCIAITGVFPTRN